MKIRHTIFLVAAFAVSSPSLAEEATKEAAKEDPEKVVCRSTTKTGSIMRQRECHTAAVWKELSTATTNVSEQAIDKLRTTRVLRDSDF